MGGPVGGVPISESNFFRNFQIPSTNSQESIDPLSGQVVSGSFEDLQFDSSQLEDLDLSKIPPGTLSWNFLMKLLNGSRSTLRAQLVNTAIDDAKFTREFILQLIGNNAALITLFDTIEAQFLSDTERLQERGTAVEDLNQKRDLMAAALANLQNASAAFATATDQFQTAIDTFNDQVATGFADDAERDAAIAVYNNAVNAYNSALATYHSARDAAQTAVDSYNNSVTSYNLLIDQINSSIDTQNQQRTADGLPLIPHQPSVSQTSFNASDTLVDRDLLPVGEDPTSQLDAPATPTLVFPSLPGLLVDPRTLDFKVILNEQFFPALIFALGSSDKIAALFSRAAEEDRFFDPRSKFRVRPEVMVSQNTPIPTSSGGVGGIGMALHALGFSSPAIQAIFSQSQLAAIIQDQRLRSPEELVGQLFLLTLLTASRISKLSIQTGTANLSSDIEKFPPDSPVVRAAQALGFLQNLLGLLRNGVLEQLLLQFVQKNVAGDQSKLNGEQQRVLAARLAEQVGVSLQLTAVGALSSSLSVTSESNAVTAPPLFNVFETADLLAAPPDSTESLESPSAQLQSAIARHGSGEVESLLRRLLERRLQETGFDSEAAKAAAKAAAQKIIAEGLGATASDLRASLATSLKKEREDKAVQASYEAVLQFVSASNLKNEVQKALIKQGGAQGALTLSDKIVSSLVGFSVDYTEGTLVYADKNDQRPHSLAEINAATQRTLREQGIVTSNEQRAGQYRDTHLSDISLDSYQRQLIDPGQTFYGLMYEGTGGSRREKKDIDIRL